jgi:hypothetical protein
MKSSSKTVFVFICLLLQNCRVLSGLNSVINFATLKVFARPDAPTAGRKTFCKTGKNSLDPL